MQHPFCESYFPFYEKIEEAGLKEERLQMRGCVLLRRNESELDKSEQVHESDSSP